jgi:hypothetical protein
MAAPSRATGLCNGIRPSTKSRPPAKTIVRPPIVVRREDREAERATAGKRDAISLQSPRLPRVHHPAQHDRGAGESQIRHHLETDDERQRARHTDGRPAASPLRIGETGDDQRDHGELPAMMVDPGGREHAEGRGGTEQHEGGKHEAPGCDQAPRRQSQADQHQIKRQDRRDRDRGAFGDGGAEERLHRQDDRGDRQIDEA